VGGLPGRIPGGTIPTMTTPAPTRPITAEEFLHMPESDGAELLDGVIVEKNGGNESSILGIEIAARIWTFIRGKKLGRVAGSDNGLRIWPNRPRHVRKPDVTFVRSTAKPVPGWLETVPHFVVEVVSPNDLASDLERKLADYREAGIPMIWVIYPETRSAQVLTPTARLDVHPNGTLEAGEVLPGFTLSLEDLFRSLDEE
jgi:Uma2 family endonuclease